MGVSVLILTKNEESNIAGCLAGLSFSDDIVVLDSCSTDRTVDIATAHPNVRIFTRAFDTEYRQRNYGLHDISYKNRWVYICDADERLEADAQAEIEKICADETVEFSAFRLRYKNMFLNRWIKHATGYPVWLIRLVRPERVKYESRGTNVHPIVDGTIGELRGHFKHYSFSNGFRRWFEKHNFYSTHEAAEGLRVRKTGILQLKGLRSEDPILRRRALKNLSYVLRGRAFWRFCISYFLRLGFLDGLAGLQYCIMVSMYEFWIELKILEREQDWSAKTERLATQVLRQV
jgi:glycosyltransferase involved in cell wall biosynthesis